MYVYYYALGSHVRMPFLRSISLPCLATSVSYHRLSRYSIQLKCILSLHLMWNAQRVEWSGLGSNGAERTAAPVRRRRCAGRAARAFRCLRTYGRRTTRLFIRILNAAERCDVRAYAPPPLGARARHAWIGILGPDNNNNNVSVCACELTACGVCA